MLTNVARRRLAEKAMKQQVLIIEDEFLIALDVADTVENMGLKVTGLATNRTQALAHAGAADIAIVDVNLTDGRTGPEIARELTEKYGVTVIFMTANPEDVDGQATGSLGILTKPVMPHVLEQSIEFAIAVRLGGMAAVPNEMRVFPQGRADQASLGKRG